MSSYWIYYLVWLLASLGSRQPWLLAGILVIVLLQPYIPDPSAIGRAFGRMRALRQQVDVNPANALARRDLATIYIDLRRPRAALPLVEQALQRTPDDPDLLYLHGLALHRSGQHAKALEPVEALLKIRPSLKYGEPHRLHGDVLFALDRVDEAIAAYTEYSRVNHSDVAVWISLAQAYARRDDRAAAAKAISTAISTFDDLTPALRRHAYGDFISAQWARVWLVREPLAIGVAVALAAGLAVFAAKAAPRLGRSLQSARNRLGATAQRPDNPGNQYGLDPSGTVFRVSPEMLRTAATAARCGSQSTGVFGGRYEFVEVVGVDAGAADGGARGRDDLERMRAAYANFEVGPHAIRVGDRMVSEWCLTSVHRSDADSLRAEAMFHEDIGDPGDAQIVEITFERAGDSFLFTVMDPEAPPYVVRLRRR